MGRNHLILATLALAAGATAQQATTVPPAIKARVNELVARCAAAGGTLGDMSGQGKFVIPADFTGDGKTDFVVSEGNFPCTGRPNLFRQDGLALVELHVADGRGGTSLAFAERLLAYRIVAGPPARLQIARRGIACGTGNTSARCGDELRWSPQTRSFNLTPTDGRPAAPAVAVSNSAVASGPSNPAAAPLAVLPDARAKFMAQCQRETRARYAQMSAANVTTSCSEGWNKVEAGGPVADALLAAVPAKAGDKITLADLRKRLPQFRWQSEGKPQRTAPDAVGSMGKLTANAYGAPIAQRITLAWAEMEADPPYDAAGALAARGAKVTALGCYAFGPSEVSRAYVVEAPGRAPFSLETYTRAAAMGGQQSSLAMTADLGGKLPTPASLRATHRDPAWQANCPY